MPRTLSSNILESLTASTTGEAYLVLITVKDNDKVALARFTSDTVDTVVAPDRYLPYPFIITLPDNQEGQETSANLVLTNVDRQLIDDIRQNASHLYVDLAVVLGSDPTDNLAYYPDMELRSVQYDTMTISGTLTYESFLREPYPKDIMSGRYFPGLFQK